jgi:hypothetical protein
VETLIAQLYQYVSSGGYLMKEANHMAKYAAKKLKGSKGAKMLKRLKRAQKGSKEPKRAPKK